MSETESFEEKVKSVPRQPGESILRGFKSTDRKGRRDKSSPGDAAYFHEMLERTKQIFSRYTIYRTAERKDQKAEPTKLDDATGKFDKDKLKIVCVGSDLDIWNGGALHMADMRDGCRLLRPLDSFNVDRWIKTRLKELEEAMKQDPDIVILPEFAYPPPPTTPAGGWTWAEIDESLARRADYEQQALDIVGGRDVFLMLGSFHCLMTLYNIGVIFPWGGHRDGQASYKRPERKTGGRGLKYIEEAEGHDRIKAPVLYRKRFPARKVGEQTRVPSGRDFNVFRSTFGNVLVLICSDVLDINQFMTIIRESLAERNFDFVLISAYNPATSFNTICKDLSSLAATTVVVTNANDPGKAMPESEIFVCGMDTSELLATSDVDLKDMVKLSRQEVKDSKLVIFELDLIKLNHARENQVRRLGVAAGPDVAPK